MKIIFIIGGARSGKSSFAMREASKLSGPKAFIATAEALDDEMKERIRNHKEQRGKDWYTCEEQINLSSLLREIHEKYDVIIIDCLTLWLSNLLINDKDINSEITAFTNVLSTVNCQLFIVSNEVGMGIVPDNKLGRRFRDLAGALNQNIAEVADEVYLVTAGIPVKIK